ncbi:endolytic transglycosylase MltG [Caproiciproducens faecalis]|uniref:Endolytic murein transglycosylase n=1 Tax=Caproiciproducens faecalis TaxID=2820301 RepID=A0ABS7DPS4_9FIRM|nr:endolytic transglycosylase MltG [Caproiciproducens faecalis]MBW7573309.1 endolytic transglycosylase MltG [Caproiciproducens faecalis]
MSNDRDLNEYHQKKVESFKLNIPDEDWGDTPDTDLSSDLRTTDDANASNTVISSYSDPREAQRAKSMQDEAEIKAEKAHQLRNREKGRKNKAFFRFIWIIMVLFASILFSQFMITGINDMLAIGKERVSVTVEIPKNATTGQVAGALNTAGIVRDVNFFQLYSKLTKADGHYSNGSYKIDTNMDYEAIINSLQSNMNRVDTVKITFKEGANMLEIADLMEKNGVCSAKEVLAAVNSDAFDKNYEMLQAITNEKDRYYKLEGYLFPDTYEFYKDEDPDQAIAKLLSNCNKKLTKQIRNKAAAQNMTIDQMMTLASMIQAEAADKEDMYKISSVFHNRLSSGGEGDLLRLRSDPTTYYPYRTKASVPSDIRETYKSKYDTYTIKGLPAGPICNPGADAIDAALNPASTNYYYFCHDKNGKAYYAKTNAQHEANLKKAGLK